MLILAIETSCDDTACAVLEVKGLKNPKFSVRASVVSSQVKLHSPFGGVVPTLASREHLKNLPVVFAKTLRQAKVTMEDIDYIAVTKGPGLTIALLIGIQFARGLAYAYGKKIIPVNHIAGHILSNWLAPQKAGIRGSRIAFPVLNAVVSGGHTELILMKKIGHYESLGSTRDDAAGEAFDKASKMLGFGYPGGPIISKLAQHGNPGAFPLPRPMMHSGNYDFSFSGLKTAVFYLLKNNPKIKKSKKQIADLCASFEQAVTDVVTAKTVAAAKEYGAKTVTLSGGVSANTKLRETLRRELKNAVPKISFLVPDFSLSTDNAVMIGVSAFFDRKHAISWKKLDAEANLSL
jgi:N6-L-threonylcarbamoyladenine synthase